MLYTMRYTVYLIMVLYSQLAKARAFEEKNCRSAAEVAKIEKYDALEVMYNAKCVEVEDIGKNYMGEIKKLKSIILKLEVSKVSVFDCNTYITMLL